MVRADAEHHWSDTRAWRDAAGWLGAFDRPFTLSERPKTTWPGAFSRALGATSAAMDLATFAEEALVPAPGPADDAVACREFSKSRALADFLGLPAPDSSACPAFERWARSDALSHAEILFVTPSGRAPESLFGHLALRLVHDDPTAVEAPDFGVVVQPVALSGSEQNGLAFAWHGLTGDYALATLTVPLGDVLRESALYEQRTIRRFRLRLDRAELRRLLERAWEAERLAYPSYFFFTENCASELVSLIDGAVGPDRAVGRPGFLYVAPAAALDRLAPLLEPIADPLPSSLDHVRRADDARRRALAPANAPDRSLTRADLDAVEASLTPVHYAWVRASLDLAHALAEVAIARKIALHLATLTTVPDEPAQRLVAERQADFALESDVQRRLGAYAVHATLLERLERAPHRPFTTDEQQALAEADAALADFRALARRTGDWVDRLFPAATLAATPVAALPMIRASGLDLVSFGATVGRTGPALTLRGALIAERLGDQRADGHHPATELRVADGALSWDGHLRAEPLTVVAFRTLARPPMSLRRSFTDSFGWGVALDTTRTDARLRLEALYPLDEGPNFARFTALSLGLAATGRWLGGDVGPRIGLESRVPFGTSSLRITSAVAPAWSPAGWSTSAELALRVEIPLLPESGHGPTVVLEGAVRRAAELSDAWGGAGLAWR